MKVISSIDDAVGLVGQELGVGEWKKIDQKRIDAFADVTEDHQWIHIDVDRAKTESPYGTTIAHGFLTLSMIPKLSKDNFRVENAKMAINYGLNKVRFLAAVPSARADPRTVGARRRREDRRQHGQPHRRSTPSSWMGRTSRPPSPTRSCG